MSGHTLRWFHYLDTGTNKRTRRPCVINDAIAANGAASCYVFFRPSDRIGGSQSPSRDREPTPRSAVYYDDDPAHVAAGTPCWSEQ